MCGIVAVYGELAPDVAREMLESITHRGPDEDGSVEVGDAWLKPKGL